MPDKLPIVSRAIKLHLHFQCQLDSVKRFEKELKLHRLSCLKRMWTRYILQLGSPSNVVNYWSFANIKLRTHFVQRISIFLQFTVRNLRAKHNVSYLIIICAQGKQ